MHIEFVEGCLVKYSKCGLWSTLLQLVLLELVKYLNIDVVKVTSGLKLLFKRLEFINNNLVTHIDLKNKSNLLKIQEY